MDEKTAALIHLQRVTMEQNAASPVKNADITNALESWGMGSGSATGHGGGSSSSSGGAGPSADSSAAAVSAKMLMSTPQVQRAVVPVACLDLQLSRA